MVGINPRPPHVGFHSSGPARTASSARLGMALAEKPPAGFSFRGHPLF